jgi:PAS domain S-box-containing protein
VVISAVRDEHGDLRGYVKVTRDLSARRKAEEELRQSEERLRLMIESVRDYAIFMLNPDGYVATWNPGAERLKGYTAGEIIGQHFSRFYPPEELASGKPARELEIAASSGKFEEENVRVRKDGTRFWAGVVLSAVRNDKGELLGFAKITRDLTSRKRAAEEMEQRARQQAAVAELGLYAVQATQLPALLERAVQTARETLGVDEIAIVGADDAGDPGGVRVPIHAADRKAVPYGYLSVAAGRSIGTGDASFLQAVANVVSAAISRAQMEQQLRAAERATIEERGRTQQAQEALRVRDEFISVAAHELRTPLTALHLKLQGLERNVRGTGTKEAQRLEAAVRQAERLARLIDRLLDVSRISQGKLEMSLEPFDLVDLLRQVMDDFREPAAQAQTPLELEAPSSLQGCWDRLRLEQVLVNVLSNAVKYGAGKPIRIRLAGDERRVRLEVSDAGIGIPAADLDRIFGRFERASSIRHYGGLGLGLYITRHIVEGHGGTISAASTPGQGSTFTVDLPRFGEAAARSPRVRA